MYWTRMPAVTCTCAWIMLHVGLHFCNCSKNDGIPYAHPCRHSTYQFSWEIPSAASLAAKYFYVLKANHPNPEYILSKDPHDKTLRIINSQFRLNSSTLVLLNVTEERTGLYQMIHQNMTDQKLYLNVTDCTALPITQPTTSTTFENVQLTTETAEKRLDHSHKDNTATAVLGVAFGLYVLVTLLVCPLLYFNRRKIRQIVHITRHERVDDESVAHEETFPLQNETATEIQSTEPVDDDSVTRPDAPEQLNTTEASMTETSTQGLAEAINAIFECTFEILNTSRANTLTNLAASIAQIDQHCRVPIDSEYIQAFKNKCQAVADLVIQGVSHQSPVLGELQRKLVGSFPNETKAGDLDDFDFSVYIPKEKSKTLNIKLVKNDQGSYHGRREKGDINQHMFHEAICEVLKSVNEDGRTTIHDVFQRGPTTTIRIRWTCLFGHPHAVRIDLTLACEFYEQVKEFIKYGKLWARWSDKLKNYIDDSEYVMLTCKSGHKWPLSSSLIDMTLHKYLKDMSNGVALPYIRCLKMLCKLALPNLIFQSDSQRGYRIIPYIESHTIKSFVYHLQHVMDMADMELEEFIKKFIKYFGGDYRNLMEGGRVCGVKDPITSHLFSVNIDTFTDDDINLIDHIEEFKIFDNIPEFMKTTGNTHQENDSIDSFDSKSYLKVHGKYHETHICKDVCIEQPMCLVSIPDSRTMTIYNLPLVRNILKHRKRNIKNNLGVDLRNIGTETLKAWKEYCLGRLKFDDLSEAFQNN